MQNGTLVWFQPQVESWTDRKKIVAWSAVAYTPLTATQAALGTIKIEGDTQVSVVEDVVSWHEDHAIQFPNALECSGSGDGCRSGNTPQRQRVLDLDRLLAMWPTAAAGQERQGLKVDPPTIYQATGPAILLNLKVTHLSPIRISISGMWSTRTGIC
jgi:hypothetical protein